jgi:hypothetical protein
MNPEDLLAQLRNLDTPAALSWWPPALGWWILASLILAVLVAGIFALIRRHRAGAAARKASIEIKAAHEKYLDTGSTDKSTAEFLQEVNAIIKRLAVNFEGNEEASGLTGRSWRNYLSEIAPDLSATELDPFELSLYQETPSVEVDELMLTLSTLINSMRGVSHA